jgi:hypothetical protein
VATGPLARILCCNREADALVRPSIASTDEYLVVQRSASRFDWLLRKDDFLDEGVAAVFGLAGDQAELLPLSFPRLRVPSQERSA